MTIKQNKKGGVAREKENIFYKASERFNVKNKK